MTKYIMIYPNFKKKNIIDVLDKIVNLFLKNKIKVLMSNHSHNFYNNKYIEYLSFFKCIYKCEVIITIGGDGTILSIADIAAYNNKPILGINLGTLGFITTIELQDINNIIEILNKKNSYFENRMLLQTKVYRKKSIIYNNTALNDITIYKYNDFKALNINLYINNHHVFKFISDGIIFSTATGSTAYSLSAGGSIIQSTMECINIVPICSHNTTVKSFILSSKEKIVVNAYSLYSSFCKLSTDGKYYFNILPEDIIKIKKSKFKLKLLKYYNNTIFDDVNKKLLRRY